ncbi:TolC family protein [Ottowia thiooxydans]|uniref:TolC family protein n=1 Tax=Ottowia thiooxydans TaxID=219182 RepID=UPI000418FCFF
MIETQISNLVSRRAGKDSLTGSAPCSHIQRLSSFAPSSSQGLLSVLVATALAWGGMPMSISHAASADVAVQTATEQTPAPQHPVTLEEYLRLVVRNQPALAAEQLQVNLARADSRTARAFPNPSIAVSRKPGEREWSVQQPLPIFGQRSARIEQARKGETTAAEHARAAVATTLDEAAQAFNELLVAQRRLLIWQEASQELDKAGRIVRGQIDAGARSRYDGARLSLQQARMAMEVSKAGAAVQEAGARVAAQAALPVWVPRAEGSLQAGPTPKANDFDRLWETTSAQLASLRSAQADLDQARHKVELARREAIPTPSIGVTRVTNRFDGNYTQLGISVEIPLFDRQRGAIDHAGVEADQARLRRDAALLSAQSGLRTALQQLALRHANVVAYEREGLAQIAPLRQMAQDAYQLGRGGILDLIDALESITEHRIEHLDLVKDLLDAEWQLRVASGNLPDIQP